MLKNVVPAVRIVIRPTMRAAALAPKAFVRLTRVNPVIVSTRIPNRASIRRRSVVLVVRIATQRAMLQRVPVLPVVFARLLNARPGIVCKMASVLPIPPIQPVAPAATTAQRSARNASTGRVR